MPSWAARSGQQLAGGFLGCLDGILGDQEWLFKVLQLKRPLLTNSSYVFCCLCCLLV